MNEYLYGPSFFRWCAGGDPDIEVETVFRLRIDDFRSGGWIVNKSGAVTVFGLGTYWTKGRVVAGRKVVRRWEGLWTAETELTYGWESIGDTSVALEYWFAGEVGLLNAFEGALGSVEGMWLGLRLCGSHFGSQVLIYCL